MRYLYLLLLGVLLLAGACTSNDEPPRRQPELPGNSGGSDDDEQTERYEAELEAGTYHALIGEESDGTRYYTTFRLEDLGLGNFEVLNFFDYDQECFIALYDSEAQLLTFTGQTRYEGEVDDFFGCFWYQYADDENLLIGLVSYADENSAAEGMGDDPFQITVDPVSGHLDEVLGNLYEVVIDAETGEILYTLGSLTAGTKIGHGAAPESDAEVLPTAAMRREHQPAPTSLRRAQAWRPLTPLCHPLP